MSTPVSRTSFPSLVHLHLSSIPVLQSILPAILAPALRTLTCVTKFSPRHLAAITFAPSSNTTTHPSPAFKQ